MVTADLCAHTAHTAHTAAGAARGRIDDCFMGIHDYVNWPPPYSVLHMSSDEEDNRGGYLTLDGRTDSYHSAIVNHKPMKYGNYSVCALHYLIRRLEAYEPDLVAEITRTVALRGTTASEDTVAACLSRFEAVSKVSLTMLSYWYRAAGFCSACQQERQQPTHPLRSVNQV